MLRNNIFCLILKTTDCSGFLYHVMLKAFIDILFPPLCHGCSTLLTQHESFLCLDCLTHLPRTLYHLQPSPNPMESRFAGRIPFERATAFLSYSHDSVTSFLIHDFKYRNVPQLARRLGSLMAEELSYSGFFRDIDAIIPMPIHWTRRLHRGYNQTEHMAEGMSEVLDIPIADNLKTRRPHQTQTRLSTEERRKNISGIFSVRHPEQLIGKHILLLDDVCTTGSTMLSAAQKLILTTGGIPRGVAIGTPPIKLSLLALAATPDW